MHPAKKCKVVIYTLALILYTSFSYAGNTPCTATPLANDMTVFETYSNIGNTNSGVEDPGCGNYITADIWFAVTAPANGLLDIVTLAGSLTNGAMAFYEGPCNNLSLISCMDDDNCGNSIMPIMQLDNLTPGNTYYIRIWAENGNPNGDFQIRVSNGPLPVPPIPTTSLVGTAFMTNNNGVDCVQLTTTTTGQSGCAWDPDQINMSQPFDQTFNLNFGNNDAGADGICWVFQNNPSGLNACGNTGQQIAANINNSFIIEMDTYDNGPGFGDIPQDHVSANVNGNMGGPINGPNSLGNIEDGQDHEVRFIWDPSVNSYEVYFDGNLVLSGVYDIINNCLGGNPFCYWGFTGSTGGAVNNQTVCPVAPPPYPAGDELTFDVEICEGESYYAGGANQTTSGTYIDFFTSYNGCDSIINTNLTVVPASNYEYDAAVCQGDCETVGANSYCNSGTYQTSIPGGNYLGCDSIVTLNLTVLDPLAVIWPPEAINCYNPVTILDGSLSTAAPGSVTYVWTGPGVNCIVSGDGTPVVSVNCPGTYTLTIIQTLGNAVCSSSNSVTVGDNTQPPVANVEVPENINCEDACVILDAGASSSGPEFAYTWTGPSGFTSDEQYPLVCEPGFYTLTVFNLSTGCQASDFVEVEGNTEPPTAVAEVSELLTCDLLSVTIDGNNSFGNGNLTFEWVDENGNILGNDATINVENAGNYVLIITDDSNGCTDQAAVLVEQNTEEPNAQATVAGDLTCDDQMVTLDGTNSTGLGTLSFEWLDENLNSFSLESMTNVNAPGIYTLIITDEENGCTSQTDIEVFENTQPPVIDAVSSGNLDCIIESVSLDGSNSNGAGNLDFAWFDEQNISIGNNAMVTVNAPGNYTLIITDQSNGCTAETTLSVEENTENPLSVINSSGDLSCSVETVSLDGSNSSGSGTIGFEWLDENDNVIGADTIINVFSTGIYTLIITDLENGCSSESSLVVSEDITPPVSDAGPGNTLTCDSTTVTLDGTGSSSGNNIEYEWLNTGNVNVGENSTIEVSETGTYTLIVTNTGNGCTASSTVEVTPDDDLPTADAGTGQTLTCNDLLVILDGSSSSTGNNISYEWLNPANVSIGQTQTIQTDSTGTYTLVVTNTDNGCTATSTVEVEDDFTTPVADAGENQTLTCGQENVTLEGSGSGSNDLSFLWQNPLGDSIAAMQNIVVNETGIYTLIITNNENGCTEQATVEVLEDVNAPDADAGPEGLLTCDLNSWMLDGSNSTGGTLTYAWQNDQGDTISTAAETEITSAGIYTLVVTDTQNGCSSSATVEILEDLVQPEALAYGDTVLTCNISMVTLQADTITGTINYAYEWVDNNGNTLGTAPNFNVSNTGIYTLLVTDENNGCTATDAIEVVLNDTAPVADAGPQDTLTCSVSTVTYDANASSGDGTLAFVWFDENGNAIGNEALIDLTSPGSYSLIVTDQSNGCTAETLTTVFENTIPPIADAGPGTTLTCDQTTASLSGSGSSDSGMISYEWQNNNAVVIGNTPAIDIAETGIFTLIVTDLANGCTAQSTVAVTPDEDIPELNVSSPINTLNCLDTVTTLIADASVSGQTLAYEWLDFNNQSIGSEPTVAVTEPGIYTIIVTNEDNGCSATTTIEIFENIEIPVADAGPNGILTCDVTQITLDGSNSSGSDLSFAWFDENGNLLDDQALLSADQPGAYQLVVTNQSNGCSSSAVANVAPDDNLPSVDLFTDGMLNCANNSVLLDGSNSTSVSGNMSFEWLDNQGSTLATTNQLNISTPGEYILIVTDTGNGCSAIASQIVDQDIVEPQVDAGENQTLTCEQTEVSLVGNGIGSMNLSYEWLDENNTTIANDSLVMVSASGTYVFMVTNADNGCTASAAVEVDTDMVPPVADAGTAETLTCSIEEVLLDAGGSSTGTDFNYEWQNENGTAFSSEIIVLVNQPGLYTLTVFDTSNGCTAESEVVVMQDIELPSALIEETVPLSCDIASLILDGNNSAPGGNLSFFWETDDGNILSDENTPNPEVNQTGTYTLTVTNLTNGCTNTSSIFVDQNITPPVAIINSPQVLTCTLTEIILDATASSTGNYTYSWTSTPAGGIISGETTLEPLINLAGTYTLTVLNNENGCETATAIQVNEDIIPPVAAASVDDEFDCLTESVSLDGNGSSIGTEFTYLWTGTGTINDETSLSPTVYQSGVYNLEVTNIMNGCTAIAEVLVTENPDVPNGLDYAMQEPACFGDLGSITIFATLGGQPPYLYSLDGGENFSAETFFPDLNPGMYPILVQDAAGCEYEEMIGIPAVIELEVSVEPEVQLNLGEAYQINTQLNVPLNEIDTIIWSPVVGLSCYDCLNPRIDSLRHTTLFTVTVINKNGCIAVDEIMVVLKKTREIFIPNAFSPHDADGFNDVFMIFAGNNKVRRIHSFRVFDRWGEIVYEAYNFMPNDPDFGWNGKLRGDILNPAVFVYLAEIEFIDDVVELYKGDVTLMR